MEKFPIIHLPLIKGPMSAVLETAVEAKIKKIHGFVKNWIFSIFD